MSRRKQLERIELLLARLDAAVVVRDPGTARAAEQYEGLRKQILQSGKSHRIHLTHLLSLADSIERGANIELIRDRVNDYMTDMGLQRTSDTSISNAFEIVEGEGSVLECIEPSVIEQISDGSIAIHRQGKARRVVGPPTDNRSSESPIEERGSDVSPKEPRSSIAIVLFVSICLILGSFLLGRCTSGDKSLPAKSGVTTVPSTTTAIPTTTTTIKP